MFDDMDGVAFAAEAGPKAGRRNGGGTKEPTRVRMEFPETWLWSESSTGYHVIAGCYLWCEVIFYSAGAVAAEIICDSWFTVSDIFLFCCHVVAAFIPESKDSSEFFIFSLIWQFVPAELNRTTLSCAVVF